MGSQAAQREEEARRKSKSHPFLKSCFKSLNTVQQYMLYEPKNLELKKITKM